MWIQVRALALVLALMGPAAIFAEPGVDTKPASDATVDADGDLISDRFDACPLDAGVASLGGCPDRDGDQAADGFDACPDTAGLPAYGGCPDPKSLPPELQTAVFFDADADGTPDAFDSCLATPGSLAAGGCPDADADGVPEPTDQCPDQPGSFFGCSPPEAGPLPASLEG